MTDDRVIARLLCGRCVGQRHVIARIVDRPEGAALRARLRRPDKDPAFAKPETVIDEYVDIPLADMPPQSNWWWKGSAPAAATIGCPKHGAVAITSAALREVEAEYRSTGRQVARVFDY